jgi:formamidopyrimidine-DNA glycosylase
MPELPEVEIISRLLGQAVQGAEIESVLVTGLSTLRSFDPPIDALNHDHIRAIRRRGKHLILETEGGLCLLIHLMSAGRLQLYDKRGSPRDRTTRLALSLSDGRELRLREFGTRQSSWAKLVPGASVGEDEALATLGPEAWPDPPPLTGVMALPRPLNSLLRDQRVVAGIGRSWADEILHEARLSPYKAGANLNPAEVAELEKALSKRLGDAIDHYEKAVSLPIPDKLPMPLTVHHRPGHPCPRCGADIRAVHFEGHEMCYCPACQTEGRVLKDRRLSRLVK